MYWVLQNNIFEEEGFGRLLESVQSRRLRHSVHKVIPFVGDLVPEPVVDSGEKVIVMGSYSMANYARRMNWTPGAFVSDNLDYEVQCSPAAWGESMFNHDAFVTEFGNVPEQEVPFFIRPVGDTKAFPGQIMDWPGLQEWQSRIAVLTPDDDPTLSMSTRVVVSQVREILQETRTWIVDRKVVTASVYNAGQPRAKKRYHADVDLGALKYARICAERWSPDRAFVLDVFTGKDGYRVGEANSFNSAGFYAADTDKIVYAIERMA